MTEFNTTPGKLRKKIFAKLILTPIFKDGCEECSSLDWYVRWYIVVSEKVDIDKQGARTSERGRQVGSCCPARSRDRTQEGIEFC